ncbi:MAG: ferritin-like domain-containing protein [Gammaproteobacteria bacterium]|nr:ferritin-like domain-containing protein [Gammaproteobacteria bacterium]
MADFYRRVEAAILTSDPAAKCRLTDELQQSWDAGCEVGDPDSEILPIDDPGRPLEPELVDPRQLPRRGFASEEGRIRLLHAFAHIEFNAINIALDAVYRFRQMPANFRSDWLLVATEEARHFQLLQAELLRRGSYYGACQAHRGLWDMVCKTRDNALHRMALVPRVMEARGLDVTPAMITKFRQFDDLAAVDIMAVIYRDEVGHVRIGNYWFNRLCEEQSLDAEVTFRKLVDSYMGGKLRGPFNRPARLEAGFRRQELDALEQDAQ